MIDYDQFKEMLKEALTNNLTIEVERDDWDYEFANIRVSFDGQLVASDYFRMGK